MTVGFLRPRIQVGITPVTRRQSFKIYTRKLASANTTTRQTRNLTADTTHHNNTKTIPKSQ